MTRLLIVEDEEAHRELIAYALKDFDPGTCTWRFAGRLDEAKKSLKEEPVDLILLDLSLPDSPYHETLRRALAFAFNTPIIVLTSLDDRDTLMGMIQQGAKDCIPKSMLNGFFLERSITYCLDRERILRRSVERERELEQEVSFHRLFNRSKIGFVICDPRGRIIEANPAFVEWLGYERDALIGHVVEEFTAEEHRGSSTAAMRRVRDGEADEVSMEKEYICADGRRVWGNVVIQRIQWMQRRDCTIASIFDLTENKRAQQRLQAANDSKSGLVAMISHDVRSPLTNIIAMAGYLEESNLPGEELECIAGISKSGRKMLEIIDDILTFAQAEQGKIEIEKKPVAVCDLVREVIGLQERRARDKGVALTGGCDQERTTLQLDAHRLQQILSNLLSNAIKFTPKGGEVRIASTIRDGWLRISVTDTGIGISETDQERLFKPFSQANPQIQKQFGGTGLGLSISRQLAELMDGSISLQSAPGAGSTFTLSIPAESTP